MKFKKCIYRLISPSGKSYVGQAVNINKRIIRYRNFDCKSQTKLFNAIKKYGWQSFKIEILDNYFGDDSDGLSALQAYYICKYECVINGYNTCYYGRSWAGRNHSQKAKKKISIGHLKRKIEDVKESNEKRKNTNNRKNQNQKKQISHKTSVSVCKLWQNRTQQQRDVIRSKQSEVNKKRSLEQRQALNEKLSLAHKHVIPQYIIDNDRVLKHIISKSYYNAKNQYQVLCNKKYHQEKGRFYRLNKVNKK